MTVGQLRALLGDYDTGTRVAIVWPGPQQTPEWPCLAEIEELITATDNETGEVDLFSSTQPPRGPAAICSGRLVGAF